MPIDYQSAGVNIAAGNDAVNRIKPAVRRTFSRAVLTDIGQFGAMYDLLPIMQTYRHPVLVQSMDGVGTKMMVAKRAQQFDTIGIDLVSATTNDIVVLGAKPLTLLDYIASEKLNPVTIERIVAGMAQACCEHGIALVGGEMAEMPGTYCAGEYDLVGIVTGIVEKEAAITGQHIAVGDQLFAFASNGLHTNGYSLARKLFFEHAQFEVDTWVPELQQTIGEALLKPHLNYLSPVTTLLQQKVMIKGMAHITGGGILENVARILPDHCQAMIYLERCPVPPIFQLLRQLSQLPQTALYRTFNMGMGLVMVVAPQSVSLLQAILKTLPPFACYHIGEMVAGHQEVQLIA